MKNHFHHVWELKSIETSLTSRVIKHKKSQTHKNVRNECGASEWWEMENNVPFTSLATSNRQHLSHFNLVCFFHTRRDAIDVKYIFSSCHSIQNVDDIFLHFSFVLKSICRHFKYLDAGMRNWNMKRRNIWWIIILILKILKHETGNITLKLAPLDHTSASNRVFGKCSNNFSFREWYTQIIQIKNILSTNYNNISRQFSDLHSRRRPIIHQT